MPNPKQKLGGLGAKLMQRAVAQRLKAPLTPLEMEKMMQAWARKQLKLRKELEKKGSK